MRIEPLNNIANVGMPTVGGITPQSPNPSPNLEFIPNGIGLDAFGGTGDNDAPNIDFPFADMDNSDFNLGWMTFNPIPFVSNLYAPQSNLYQPLPSETSTWVFTSPDSSATAPPRPQQGQDQYQNYLPLIQTPKIEPSNTIIALPDTRTTLISTDGSLMLEIPSGAVNAPTQIDYKSNSINNPDLPSGTESFANFSLTAFDMATGNPVTQFDTPLILTLSLPNDLEISTLQQVTLATWTQQNGWELLPTTLNPEKLTISAYTEHFTHFELLATTNPGGGVVLAPHIPTQASMSSSYFYGYSTTYEFTGDSISLYPVEANGTHLWTDDFVNITVFRPDGSQYIRYHDYDLGGPGINPRLPIDITDWFIIGTNGISIELIDKIAPNRGSSGYQILPGSACESQPPQVNYMELSQTGQNANSTTGTTIIKVNATDNSGDVFVTVSLNGVWYSAIPYGNGDYILTLDYPVHQMNDYIVNVEDSCGNQAENLTVAAHGTDSDNFGWSHCGKAINGCGSYQMPSDDPVNTANGNYYDRVLDLTVAGVGSSDLSIERAYNSMGALWTGGATTRYTVDGDTVLEEQVSEPSQYFGTGWTFPYAVSLNVQSYPPYYDGAQVTYPDGHTANFIADGGGSYVSSSPASFDTLTLEGSEYVLLHKNTLEIERFDMNGRLTSREDRNGNTISLTYDGKNLSRIENDSGRWIEFAYTDGYITTITAPESRVITYDYTNDLLTSVIDGNEHTTRYGYDDNKQLITITTPKEHTALDQVYDDQYRVDWQKIGRAEINDFTYSEDGLTTTITDSYNRNTHYIYNEFGQIIEMVDALNFSETYSYNENYNRTHYTDQMGHGWQWTYGDNGNRLTEDGPMGWHQQWTYNSLNRVTSQITKIDSFHSRETLFGYDSKGNLTDISNALDNSSHIDYDGRGLPTNVFDFNGNETINTYDPITGDLIETHNGAGDTVGFGYDDLGRMVEMTDGNSNVYDYSYDDADNLTDINGPLGYHIGYRYDDNDNLRLEIDPNGGDTKYWYDESEMVTRIENQLDFPTIFAYDDMDNLYRLENAEGREWFYKYDKVYNQTAVHAPEDTHTLFSYNGVRNVTSVTECNSAYNGINCPNNRVTTYEYNGLDQMETVIENDEDGAGKTADTNVTTQFSYDLVGNILVLSDALNNQTDYAYDLLDQLIWEKDAEEQISEYNYDANGNLVWLKNPRNKITEFSYEAANRLQTMTDADGEVWQYGYDGNGNLTDEIDPLAVVTHYQYDHLDRVSRFIQNYQAGVAETSDQNVETLFGYDLAGNRRFIYDPRGGYVSEHQYDAAHRRLLTIDNETGATEYGYDRVNNLVSVIDGNGYETIFIYDRLNRQTQITNPELHTVQFSYDRLGNTLSITDARLNTTYFTYDGMNRVVLMRDAMQGEWEYSYDAMGNVQCKVDANGHANDCYTYDNVYRVLTITDAEDHSDSFSYDANGNRLTWTDGNTNTTIYTYDNLDRLGTVTNAEVETTTYQYDPLGNQTHLIEADGIVTRYDYDPLYRLVTVNQNDQLGQ